MGVGSTYIFTSIVTLENELTNEIVLRRHNHKQAKLTEFLPSN